MSCSICRAPDASTTDHSSATATKVMTATAIENINETFITDHGSSLATRSRALRAGRTVPPTVRTRPVRAPTGFTGAAGELPPPSAAVLPEGSTGWSAGVITGSVTGDW